MRTTFIEIIVYITIALTFVLAIVTTVYQYNNPDEYCRTARKFNRVDQLPAYCVENEKYPVQRFNIKLEE